MHPILALSALATLAAAIPTDASTPTTFSPLLHPRGACQSRYTTHDYCHWFCSDCNRGSGKDWGCIQLICVEGCKAAVGYDNGGECKSHWNDGGTWAYKCTHGSGGTFVELYCSWFDENLNLMGKVVKGSYRCVGEHTAPSTPKQPSTSTELPGEGEGLKGLSASAKAAIGVGAAVGALAISGLVLWGVLPKRKRAGPSAPPDSGEPELEGTEVSKPELATGKMEPEMDGNEIPGELGSPEREDSPAENEAVEEIAELGCE
ncbi:hypothetical protein QBC34DRAFT_382260 [Podospora aff. communis PSN243]|uniref:Cyanovirin-N domain-containing protein n=1 Tax=Podospora aff. communis PSN243 TaxID=3040156 RepID=A0AAV9GIS1_9PEZI|nr:hypothetical protein QBC34DRAFT_382260 [Podospora aff. communis PSN243]